MNYVDFITLQREINRLYCTIQIQQTQISNLGKAIAEIGSTTTLSVFRGCWSDEIVYNLSDTVIYEDGIYKSLKENNADLPGSDSWVMVGPFYIDGGLLKL